MSRTQFLSISCDFEVLYLTVVNNIDYFFFIRDKYWYGDKFVLVLRELLSHFHWYEERLNEFYKEAHRFDFNEIHGNGFRSFGLIFERCFSDCYKFCKRLNENRSSIFFRAGIYLKEAESLVYILAGLKPGLNFLTKMMSDNVDNHLLMPDKAYTPEDIITECEGISQLGFYGRHQGFYYCTSMKRILQGVGVIMATFSDLYRNTGGPISRAALAILNGMKYIFNPELRAEHIVDVAQNASVEFLKSFWSLSETQFMKRLPSWVCPKMKVRKEIFVPAEPIILNNEYTNETVVIPVPTSHIPTMPVRCLLLSSVYRAGQDMKNKSNASHPQAKSTRLLLHCHGGGFISQNPESHEIYLRHWAHDLNVPIVSVDYSLSPEAPFPRALEEVLLTYAWILKNPDKLGWTGETICFAGDSAGGNILMGIVLKTITLKIRQPNAVLIAYTPLILDMVPSPSRLLCWIDPLLPIGFMISCLDAYCGAMQTDGNEYDEEPEPGLSGQRSRKISSISEIFDSSMNFFKKCQWFEVEANEPSSAEVDGVFYGSKICAEHIESNNYVDDFCKEYSIEEDILHSNENNVINEYTLFNLPYDMLFDLKTRCQKAAGVSFSKISHALMSTYLYKKVILPFIPNIGFPYQYRRALTPVPKALILQKIKKLKIVAKNPFMSPLLASDDILKLMPPVYIASLNFDPCLDDSITFAKRLQLLNRKVVLDVLDGLPHGFLNFLPFSQEAHDGSNLCVRRLKEAMKLI